MLRPGQNLFVSRGFLVARHPTGLGLSWLPSCSGPVRHPPGSICKPKSENLALQRAWRVGVQVSLLDLGLLNSLFRSVTWAQSSMESPPLGSQLHCPCGRGGGPCRASIAPRRLSGLLCPLGEPGCQQRTFSRNTGVPLSSLAGEETGVTRQLPRRLRSF